MGVDATLQSRIQFTITIMFDYLLPPLTIGMGEVLVYPGTMYLQTKGRAKQATDIKVNRQHAMHSEIPLKA